MFALRNRPALTVPLAFLLLPLAVRAAEPPSAASVEFFEKKVRPVLVEHCQQCHGDAKVKGGLKLTSRAALLKGGDTGPAVKPGDPEKSLLIQVVHYTDEMKMPPKGKLADGIVADLTRWVKDGAAWPEVAETVATKTNGQLFTPEQKAFWAFQPPKAVEPPAVKDIAWPANPIDQFLLAKLEAKGLRPAATTDRRTLIRRATFDLTGLPPTPEEVDAFLADSSPDAFARVIDRLLASPAYGERWGRHWLDVARYADSNGLDENTAFGNAWRYRDYVVNAFNKDKPYDQFVLEQIAGDQLPMTSDDAINHERLTATGFLVLGPKVLAEPDKGKMVMDIVDEQLDVTCRAFMGLTADCARCHDHKFDPIPTRDYYSLAGIFKSTRTMQSLNTVARAMEHPLAPGNTGELVLKKQKKLKELEGRIKSTVEKANAELRADLRRKVAQYLLASADLAEMPTGKGSFLAEGKQPSGTLVFEAEKFQRGDAQITTTGYGEKIGIIESAGRSNAFAEYDFDLKPTTGPAYQIEVRYASGEMRPIKVSLDGAVFKEAAAGQITGGFNPEQQLWELIAATDLKPGKHVLRIDANGALPHVDKLAVVPLIKAQPEKSATFRRERKGNAEDLAKQHQLTPAALRSFADHLDRLKKDDAVFGPWRALAELPPEHFADQAKALVEQWRKEIRDGKSKLAAPVAALFDADPPKSLQEVADRYGRLFGEFEKTLQTKQTDAGREKVRQAFASNNGPFALPAKPEDLYPAKVKEDLAKLKAEQESLDKENYPMVLSVEDEAKIENVKVHIRGNHLTLGAETPRQFFQIIAGENQTPVDAKHSGRLEMARWMIQPEHPLTARVMVNRIWEHHFGDGLVRTPDNFGKLGDRPSHPELLDWLARRFVQEGWSIKKMHKLMMLSKAYQMSTAYDEAAALADPDNRLLWHMPRRRLEVEAIRDGILAVSGNLDRTLGGSILRTGNFDYVTNDGSGNGETYTSLRRSIYLPVIRNAVFDVFQVFDFVEPSVINGKRDSTTIAPQALFLMNGPFVLEQSKAFADSLLKKSDMDDAGRIRSAYLRALGRPATDVEVSRAENYLKAYADHLAAQEKDPAKQKATAWRSLCQVLFASNEFVFLN